MKTFKEIIQGNRAWYCLDCGKCSSVCPITLHLIDEYSSPRLLVETALANGENITLEDPLLWSCLSCRRCSEICPSEVDFCAFIQEARQLAFDQGLSGTCTHSGMIQSWMRTMTDPDLVQVRLDWIDGDLEVNPESDTIYFTGCLPYFDAAFKELGIEGLEIARSAVKILNSVGIQPRIMGNERCCGHDLYWQGDMENFTKLASLNLDAIAQTGAAQIVTTCPECAYTLKYIYAEEIGEPGVEVFHLTEFLAENGALPVDPEITGLSVTYQDPCRLGRYQDIYQQPRDLLEGHGYQLVEMEHNRRNSICCGTSCWSSCGSTNKRIQEERLSEACSTGAELLVTACPKCQIHLKCAQQGPENDRETQIPIRDITTLLAEKR